jgi:hypothetical protein
MTRTALLLAPLLLAGCATIVKGTTQPVFFVSEPDGAEIIYLDGAYKTPCMIKLRRSYKPIEIELYRHGFAPANVICHVKTNGWIWGNLLFGGTIGVIVDAAFAAGMDFVEDNQRVILCPVDPEEADRLTAERDAARRLRAEATKRWREKMRLGDAS